MSVVKQYFKEVTKWCESVNQINTDLFKEYVEPKKKKSRKK